jgi:phage terminase large subunit-like protein
VIERVPLKRRRTSKPPITILDATSDPNLFASWFKDRTSWAAWFSFLAALFGLPMTTEQRQIFSRCTGRNDPPSTPSHEAWLVVGRRGGKSFVLALCAVWIACFGNHRRYLSKGERGTIMIIAADRKQARVITRYIGALLRNVPLLSQAVERETASGFDLENNITLEIFSASFRSTRGYAIAGALLDELAWMPTDDAAEPDREILAALRPGMAQFPEAMLLCASSPYARRGALWDGLGPLLLVGFVHWLLD